MTGVRDTNSEIAMPNLHRGEIEAETQFVSVQSFRPGRPTPTHRYAPAK